LSTMYLGVTPQVPPSSNSRPSAWAPVHHYAAPR
jgi:hypothetical protein